MPQLFTEFKLKTLLLKNRVVMPPIRANSAYKTKPGLVNDEHINHYKAIACGGAGLIIVEGASISYGGRIAGFQVRIEDNELAAGFEPLIAVCHEHGAKVLLQIMHGGFMAAESNSDLISASDYSGQIRRKKIRARAMTLDEIQQIQNQFVQAAVRAKKAGFDGVEIHGAHGYLLTQFFSSHVNKRRDEYGGSLDNRARIAVQIIRQIKIAAGEEFVLGMRMGSNEPTLHDSIYFAQAFTQAGVDYLHISTGFNNDPPADMTLPEKFPFNWIIYGGYKIKQEVQVPVIVVNGIKTPEHADMIINSGMGDLVAVGRAQLVDPDWVRKAQNHEPIYLCRSCKKCQWFEDFRRCPGLQQRLQRKRPNHY